MALSFPLDAPLDDIAEVDVGEQNANSFQISPFTGRGVLQAFEGDWWTLALRYRSLNRVLAQPVLAFASALRKAEGTFIIAFPGYDLPLGSAASLPSSPTVDGSDQAGRPTVTIAHAPAAQTGWLLAGDIIQIGPSSRPHWHRVLQTVDTDVDGRAEIDLWPYVRDGVIHGDPVIYQRPLGLFRLIDAIDLSLQPPVLHSIELVCREAT